MAVLVKYEEEKESQEMGGYEGNPEDQSVPGRQLFGQVNVQEKKERYTVQQLKTKKSECQT